MIEKLMRKTNLLKPAMLFLFSILVLFSHLPFFLYLNIPNFTMDTFDYSWVALELATNSAPVHLPEIDYPIGYSLFIFCFKQIGLNLQWIVYFQTLVYTFAGLYLIKTSFKLGKVFGVSTALGLMIYTVVPYTLRYNFTIHTESLYTSALICVCAALINYFQNKNKLTFSLLMVFILLGITLRSNGIVLLFIPFIIIFFNRKNRVTLKNQITLFVLIVVFPQMILNYVFKGEISFSESRRLQVVFTNNISKTNDTGQSKIKSENISKIDLFKNYVYNFVDRKPSYYFSLLPTFYQDEVVHRNALSPKQGIFDGRLNVDTFAPKLKSYIFHDMDYTIFDNQDKAKLIDYDSSEKSKWMQLIHFCYELPNKVYFFHLIYLFFGVSIGLALFGKTQFILKKQLFSLLLSAHVLSLFLLPFAHGRFQARYIHVSEFIVFIVGIYGFLFLLNKYAFPKIKLYVKQ
jgi:hypothetical protein